MAASHNSASCLRRSWADSLADIFEAHPFADGDDCRQGDCYSHFPPAGQSSYSLADAAPHADAGSAAHAHPDPGGPPRRDLHGPAG